MIRIGKDLDGQYLEFLKEKNYEKVQRKVEVTILETEPGDYGFYIHLQRG